MQRQLLIMRHAQAEEIQHEQLDRDRELTAKGQQEVLTMAFQLHQRKIALDAIHASIAVRTQKTASLVSDVMKVDAEAVFFQDDLYNSSIRTYLDFITRLDTKTKSVLLVGHNPAVSYLAEYLTKAEINSMPTAGICIVQFKALSWNDVAKDTGELVDFIYPEMFTT